MRSASDAGVASVSSVAVVEQLLRSEYGQPKHHNKKDPLGELVFILLSTQTREAEYRRTFSRLWNLYRSWDRVRRAPADEIEELIRFGGFARRKTALLQGILNRLKLIAAEIKNFSDSLLVK